MHYYFEITLIPNADIDKHFLWSKVYRQIHLGLVELHQIQTQVPIGLSFPEYVKGEKFAIIGGKCRIFAQDEATLIRFDAGKWLARLSDYVHCTSIRAVPDNLKGYATFQRIQPKTSPERLARRYAKRHNLDFETAFNNVTQLKLNNPLNNSFKQQFRYCDMPVNKTTLPFIRLKSLSSDQSFCLWIKKTEFAEPTDGFFSRYGLSSKTTVPEF